MQDSKGQELKAGDFIVIPCRVRTVTDSPEGGHCTVESIGALPGSGRLEVVTLSPRQVVRANPGDEASLK